MIIHRLQRNFAWASETIPTNLPSAGEDSGRKFLKQRLHLDCLIFVDPAAGFDIDGFAWPKRHFEYISVTVEPKNAFLRGTRERVDEEAGAAEQYVRGAFDAREGVIDVVGCREPLMFADIDAHPRFQV